MAVGLVACALAGHIQATPTASWAAACPGFGKLQAITADPTGATVAIGGDTSFGLLQASSGDVLWNSTFVDFGAELEGPFYFAAGIVAAVAPDSGTINTLWGVNASNGTLMWSDYKDSSVDQSSVVAVGDAFYAACIGSQELTRVDGEGNRTWTAHLSDLVNSLAATNDTILVAYGVVAAAYTQSSGDLVWNVTSDVNQMSNVGYDSASDVACFTANVDPDGNTLPYSTVYGFAGASGKALWATNITTSLVVANPPLVGGGVCVVSDATTVYVLSTATGRVMWKHAGCYAPKVIASPAFALQVGAQSSNVIISTEGSVLSAYERRSGAWRWNVTLPTSHNVTTFPIVNGNQLLVPTRDSHPESWVLAYSLS